MNKVSRSYSESTSGLVAPTMDGHHVCVCPFVQFWPLWCTTLPASWSIGGASPTLLEWSLCTEHGETGCPCSAFVGTLLCTHVYTHMHTHTYTHTETYTLHGIHVCACADNRAFKHTTIVPLQHSMTPHSHTPPTSHPQPRSPNLPLSHTPSTSPPQPRSPNLPLSHTPPTSPLSHTPPTSPLSHSPPTSPSQPPTPQPPSATLVPMYIPLAPLQWPTEHSVCILCCHDSDQSVLPACYLRRTNVVSAHFAKHCRWLIE